MTQKTKADRRNRLRYRKPDPIADLFSSLTVRIRRLKPTQPACLSRPKRPLRSTKTLKKILERRERPFTFPSAVLDALQFDNSPPPRLPAQRIPSYPSARVRDTLSGTTASSFVSTPGMIHWSRPRSRFQPKLFSSPPEQRTHIPFLHFWCQRSVWGVLSP